MTQDRGFRRYKRSSQTPVTAIQLRLETSGLSYQKWGSAQRCKKGDWLVDNAGEVYSIDADTFSKTYVEVSAGRYVKQAGVYAKRADIDGWLKTKEGRSRYAAGDMLVFNDAELTDGYPMSQLKFDELYALARLAEHSLNNPAPLPTSSGAFLHFGGPS